VEAEVVEQDALEPREDARPSPSLKATPARDPAAAEHFGRQVLPGEASPENEDDPAEAGAIIPSRSAASATTFERQQRRHALPQAVRYQLALHAAQHGALRRVHQAPWDHF
jgi:hypothetical protein